MEIGLSANLNEFFLTKQQTAAYNSALFMEELAVKLPFSSTHLRINYSEENRNDPGSHGVYTQLGSQTLHKYIKICVQFVISNTKV